MKKIILTLAVACFILASCTSKTAQTVENKVENVSDVIENTFENIGNEVEYAIENAVGNAIEEKLEKIEDTFESVEDKVEEVADSLTNRPLLGGDRDEHGCIPSAGYIWCEKLQKCVRPWETPCDSE